MSEPAGSVASRALRTGLGCVLASACALLAAPVAARAEFALPTLLSGSSQMQFEDANVPAFAADGRYVVFQGSIAGNPGVYRRDLETDALELVAGGASRDPEARCDATTAHPFVACDAAAPSISADGRYVAFTTTADLEPLEQLPGGGERGEPAADVGCPEVYVRDMQKAPGEPGAYTLASTLNGSEEGIAFAQRYAKCAARSGFAVAGAQAAPGVALSADGQRVAFTVLSESNLAGPETPPGEVAVSDLETHTTTLVTTNASGAPAAGGGAFPDVFALTTGGVGSADVGIEAFQAPYGDQAAASTAALSADGSTVAWLGMNVAEQVSPAEAQREPQLTSQLDEGEAEPLWRRLGGPDGDARRLLAGAGLGFFTARDPAPPPEPVETGSLHGTQHVDFIAPALSADGESVAVVATAPPAAAQASLEGVTTESEFASDAYLVQVGDDPSTPPQVRPLTEISSYAVPESQLGDVKDIAISPDGTRVAFDTGRTPLYLPSLALAGPAVPGEGNVYEAYLARGTLERVATTYDGAGLNGPIGLVSFDGDGQTLAFASQATDIFFGDAVDAWEVYAAGELGAAGGAQPSIQQIGAAPALSLPTPEWELEATVAPSTNGTVLIRAAVPGAGRLEARAGAQLPRYSKRTVRSVRTRTRGRTRASLAKRRSHAARGRRGGGSSPIPTRTVAEGTMLAAGPSELSMRLRVAAAFRRFVASRDGLYAVLRITFASPDHRTLTREVPVTFHLLALSKRARYVRRSPRKLGARLTGRTRSAR